MTWHPDTPPDYRDAIVTGDARLLAERIPDESVDLVFTDPVYDRIDDYRWLAETARRVLRPGRACLVFCGIGYLPETLVALISGGLRYRWYVPHLTLGTSGYCDTGPSRQMAMLWFENGRTRPRQPLYDVVFTNGLQDWHKWRKNVAGIARWTHAFTEPGDTVLDPFCGGGTVPAVCKMLGRHYIAFEIDPEVAQHARRRVAETMEPLPGLECEQLGMEVT